MIRIARSSLGLDKATGAILITPCDKFEPKDDGKRATDDRPQTKISLRPSPALIRHFLHSYLVSVISYRNSSLETRNSS
jgi:hypothetical protein